ncbi:MAG: sigma-70 family RNA polymerase sigma factor [Deltaproteobacteria bacterium]|nr:sigma-70 family RNA polymerase sigma factor [Deltaproteobacteria bacterium]
MPSDPTAPSHPGALTPTVFAACFRRASPSLWCIAAAVLGERTHAEDVLQEAAMTGLTKLGTFAPGTSFAAWMGQIVRFTALNHRRKRSRRAEAELTEAVVGAATAPSPIDAAFDARTTAALASLGETARACLLLKIVVELDYAAIAEILGIPAGTAMSHVHRARAQLRARLLDDATTGEELP